MNPLLSIKGTIVSGFILSAVLILAIGGKLVDFEHYLSGFTIFHITWIGLLYYFNFVQVPAMAAATADKEPGPAAIGKYVAPLVLVWSMGCSSYMGNWSMVSARSWNASRCVCTSRRLY